MQTRYLSPKEVSKYLNVSTQLLQKWRSMGVGPEYSKLGSSSSSAIRYSLIKLDEYIENNKIKTHG